MNIFLSILLSFMLALLAYIKKALDFKALLLAFVFSIIICYCGNILGFLILSEVFLSTVITHKIKPKERQKITKELNEKNGAKDIFQIIANVGTSTILIIIYYLTNNNIFLVSYSCVMAESMADSLASDIGVLSKKNPLNILTFKRGEKGLSGNISALGLIASLIGSITIGLTFAIFNPSINNFLVIAVCGFIGTLIDSLLGATIQAKYQCSKCHKITEKKSHCFQTTNHIKGIKIINNDIINLISNILTSVISLLIL